MGTRRLVTLKQFGAPEVMEWSEDKIPERGPGEVLVAVDAIGINFADTMARRGEYRRNQPLTFTPGFEVAGRIAEGARAGEPVVVFMEHGGGYADHVVAPSDRVLTLQPEIETLDAAAAFTTGVTAWYAVHRFGRVTAGDRVAVHAAAGGVGTICIQLAADAGADVIGIASTPEKLAIAERHGAVETTLSEPEGLHERLGRPDVIIDGVGGPVFAPSMRALAFNGRYVVVGSATQSPAMLDVRALMPRGQTIAGLLVGRVAELDPAEPQGAWDEIQTRMLDGRLRPDVEVIGPDDIAAAHARVEARASTGKLVVSLADWH